VAQVVLAVSVVAGPAMEDGGEGGAVHVLKFHAPGVWSNVIVPVALPEGGSGASPTAGGGAAAATDSSETCHTPGDQPTMPTQPAQMVEQTEPTSQPAQPAQMVKQTEPTSQPAQPAQMVKQTEPTNQPAQPVKCMQGFEMVIDYDTMMKNMAAYERGCAGFAYV
jgi:hypothetical protein